MRRARSFFFSFAAVTAGVLGAVGACGGDSKNASSPNESGDAGLKPDSITDDTGTTKTDAGDGGPLTNSGVFVQQKAGSQPDTLSAKVVLPNAPANGNALILAVAASIDHPTSVAGGGVTWTQQASSGTHIMTSVWAGFGVANGETTITLTYDRLQSFVTVLVTEWSGISGSGTKKTTTSGLTGDVNPTQLDATGAKIVFATVGIHNDPTTGPTGTGSLTPLETTALGNRQLLSAWGLVTASSSVFAPAWSSSKSGGWDALVVSFQP
jgi:hypothetical protein